MTASVIKTNEKEITDIINKHRHRVDPYRYMETLGDYIDALEGDIRAYQLSLELIGKEKENLLDEYSLEDDAYWRLLHRLEKRETKQMEKISRLIEDLQILRGKNYDRNNPGIDQSVT